MLYFLSFEYVKFINFDFFYGKNIIVDRKWYNFLKFYLGLFLLLGIGFVGFFWDFFENVFSINVGLSLILKGIINLFLKDNY